MSSRILPFSRRIWQLKDKSGATIATFLSLAEAQAGKSRANVPCRIVEGVAPDYGIGRFSDEIVKLPY
jgi:hypothetical protein